MSSTVTRHGLQQSNALGCRGCETGSAKAGLAVPSAKEDTAVSTAAVIGRTLAVVAAPGHKAWI